MGDFSTETIHQEKHFRSQTDNYFFQSKAKRIFQNIMLLLGKVNLKGKEVDNLPQNVINFLRSENFLNLVDFDYLAHFVSKNASLFGIKQIEGLIYMYHDKKLFRNNKTLLPALSETVKKYFPEFGIDDDFFFENLKNTFLTKGPQSDATLILDYHPLLSINYKKRLSEAILDYLRRDFNEDLYYFASLYDIIEYKELFNKYLNSIKDIGNLTNANSTPGNIIGLFSRPDYSFNYVVQLLYIKNIKIGKRFNRFRGKLDYYDFLLDNKNFDYSKFDVKWLLIWDYSLFLNRFKSITQIKVKLEQYLKETKNKEIEKNIYDKLAFIFLEYFL